MAHTLKKILDKAGKLLQLSPADKMLLLKAAALLIILRVLLGFLPVHRLSALIGRSLKKPSSRYTDHLSYAQRVIWAIETAGGQLLRTRCLPQALGGQILLNKKGIRTRLFIGFIIIKGKYSGHAWLKVDDQVIIGNTPLIAFYRTVPIPYQQEGDTGLAFADQT